MNLLGREASTSCGPPSRFFAVFAFENVYRLPRRDGAKKKSKKIRGSSSSSIGGGRKKKSKKKSKKGNNKNKRTD